MVSYDFFYIGFFFFFYISYVLLKLLSKHLPKGLALITKKVTFWNCKSSTKTSPNKDEMLSWLCIIYFEVRVTEMKTGLKTILKRSVNRKKKMVSYDFFYIGFFFFFFYISYVLLKLLSKHLPKGLALITKKVTSWWKIDQSKAHH